MKGSRNLSVESFSLFAMLALFALPLLNAQNTSFHNAPTSAHKINNPFVAQTRATQIGGQLYAVNCSTCHGRQGEGEGNVPPLKSSEVQGAKDGELFWFITKGSVNNGMPSWASISQQRRWQIVSYLKAGLPALVGGTASTPELNTSPSSAAPPPAPFTDFRFEAPGKVRRITIKDLPAPFTTSSAGNAPKIVDRPPNAWPKAPNGFKVDQYASGLNHPRLIRTAPNGDYFVAESDAGDIKVFRGISADSKPQQVDIFTSGLNRPYGIAFYPPGPNPKWVYIGNTNSVVRFPYQNGDLKARGASEKLADLPFGGGHWTRSIEFTPDGKKMYVAVGSASNVDDSDTSAKEKDRANILEFNPDGSGMGIYASGIRNPGGGLAINPKTGELWCSVNERDGLGDNLVPDYITHVQEGGFYGWPWWYMGGHQDPRHEGKHPELKSKVITPDVILQPHNASLQLAFYTGKQFPAEYRGDIFASEHGSWNKSVRVGYELIRVPLHQSGQAAGDYEDFLTGFVLENGNVWGRPVGVTVATDGSLLVSDDGSNTIWRVSYVGK